MKQDKEGDGFQEISPERLKTVPLSQMSSQKWILSPDNCYECVHVINNKWAILPNTVKCCIFWMDAAMILTYILHVLASPSSCRAPSECKLPAYRTKLYTTSQYPASWGRTAIAVVKKTSLSYCYLHYNWIGNGIYYFQLPKNTFFLYQMILIRLNQRLRLHQVIPRQAGLDPLFWLFGLAFFKVLFITGNGPMSISFEPSNWVEIAKRQED